MVTGDNVDSKDWRKVVVRRLCFHACVCCNHLLEADDYLEQRLQLEKMLHFKERHLGANHTEVASTLQKLGDVLKKP